jgi:hypothetical protein
MFTFCFAAVLSRSQPNLLCLELRSKLGPHIEQRTLRKCLHSSEGCEPATVRFFFTFNALDRRFRLIVLHHVFFLNLAGLIRKAQLSHFMKKFALKTPNSILNTSVPETYVLEVSYA